MSVELETFVLTVYLQDKSLSAMKPYKLYSKWMIFILPHGFWSEITIFSYSSWFFTTMIFIIPFFYDSKWYQINFHHGKNIYIYIKHKVKWTVIPWLPFFFKSYATWSDILSLKIKNVIYFKLFFWLLPDQTSLIFPEFEQYRPACWTLWIEFVFLARARLHQTAGEKMSLALFIKVSWK